MAYIINLTLIMQNLFWLVAIYRVPVSRRLIKFASQAYKESDAMAGVHQEVESYVQGVCKGWASLIACIAMMRFVRWSN